MAKGFSVTASGFKITSEQIGKEARVWNSDSNGDRLYEVNPETLALVSAPSSPTSNPYGIGGTDFRLYHTESSNAYELNPDTIAIITTYPGFTDYQGIGGIENRIYMSSGSDLSERNPDTLASLGSTAKSAIKGCGGFDEGDRMYWCKVTGGDDTFEVNPDTRGDINSFSTSSNGPTGVGGSNGLLFSCSPFDQKLKKINPDTGAIILQVNELNFNPVDMGGISELNTNYILTIEALVNGLLESQVAEIKYDSVSYTQ